MMIFVAEETRSARRKERKRKKEGERKRERERNEAGRASSLGPEKLSEIMSEEIGSLARGWLTARSARTTFFLSFSIPLATRYRSIYLGISTVTPTPVFLAAFFLPISSPSFRSSRNTGLRVLFFLYSSWLFFKTERISWLENIIGPEEETLETDDVYRKKQRDLCWNCRQSHMMMVAAATCLPTIFPEGWRENNLIIM